jgi:pyruvate,water dikinase
LWVLDEHTTEPQPALIAALWADALTAGFAAGMERYGFLMAGIRVTCVDGRFYLQPVPLTDPVAVARRVTTVETGDILTRLDDTSSRWHTTTLAGWHARRAELDDGLDGLGDDELADRLMAVAAAVSQFARERFTDALVTTLVAEYVFAASEVAGWDERRALGALDGAEATSAMARAVGAVADAVRGRPLGDRLCAGDGVTTVELLDEPAAAAAMTDLVDRYGDLPARLDLVGATVREGTLPALVGLHLAAAPSPLAPSAPGVPAGLRVAAERAQRAMQWREETGPLLGTWCGFLRRVAGRAGARLVTAGRLVDAAQAVDLTPDELAESLRGADHRDLAAARHAARVDAGDRVAPGVVGEPPAGPHADPDLPPAAARHQARMLWVTEHMARPRARSTLPSNGTATDGTVIVGVGVTPGCYEGTARLLRGPEDLARIRPGDVVVCPITTPSWTAVLAVAGAMVCDAGGLLSHPAIIARELAIPAVVGTGVATTAIAEGDRVVVDGDLGQVRVLP